jgi:hypothetical protein
VYPSQSLIPLTLHNTVNVSDANEVLFAVANPFLDGLQGLSHINGAYAYT